jgi:type I restriction enzyme S subunit
VVPLEDQERILADLDRRLSVADDLFRACEANLKRGERLRGAILKRAFGGKLVAQEPNDEPAETLLQRVRTNGSRASGRKAAVEGQ